MFAITLFFIDLYFITSFGENVVNYRNKREKEKRPTLEYEEK